MSDPRFDKPRVKRELRRLYLKLRLWPDYWIGRMLKARHDRNRNRYVTVTQGAQALQNDIALFLIYQPKGILASTLATCRHLTENGFSVIVVSNLPVASPHREALLAECHQLLERPNFGYDFGGYRDGVLHVLDSGMRADNLLILNDSIWFPIKKDDRFLDHLRAQKADLFGPIMHIGHLQSYMFSFKARVIRSQYFRDYWETLPLTNNKVGVVRMGEQRLTAQIAAGGFTVGALVAPETVVEVLTRHPHLGDPKTAATLYLLKSHPALLAELGVPALKKDLAPQYVAQRKALLADSLQTEFVPEVLAEITRWDQG